MSGVLAMVVAMERCVIVVAMASEEQHIVTVGLGQDGVAVAVTNVVVAVPLLTLFVLTGTNRHYPYPAENETDRAVRCLLENFPAEYPVMRVMVAMRLNYTGSVFLSGMSQFGVERALPYVFAINYT
ncbi:hypothetical protein E2542_SST13071 [Spatholobus suberectus]|nr:hypothetical protein E2542_SST13071 [Spatholobus suberectus]